MKEHLQILMVEDSTADALLIEYELRKAGVRFSCVRVENREDFLGELDRGFPDLILSDHGMPCFDGFTALELAQERCPRVPFIFVTGASDQAMMVEMLESGATDFVFKNRLGDLVPSVERALDSRANDIGTPATGTAGQNPRRAPGKGGAKAKGFPDNVLLCSLCKQVQDSSGQWVSLDELFHARPKAAVVITVCPTCGANLN
jgi:DNA-binding NtrC family response regulator